MKINIEAEKSELRDKGTELLHALGEFLKSENLEIADYLLKALPNKEVDFLNPVMHELLKKDELVYKEFLDAMLKDINSILDKVK